MLYQGINNYGMMNKKYNHIFMFHGICLKRKYIPCMGIVMVKLGFAIFQAIIKTTPKYISGYFVLTNFPN